MLVNGKTVAVTGGGNGIGRELVLELLRRGARVAAVDISEDGLAQTAGLAGDMAGRLTTHVANITDRDAVATLPTAVIAAHGQIDGLINCAGIIQPFVRFNDLSFEAIDRVMSVNFYGQVNMLKMFLPHLLQRPEAHILNVASMGAFVPVPGQTMYGASKAAVMLMTEGLYAELVDTSVGVTVAFPGSTATDIAKHSGVSAPGGQDAAAAAMASKIKLTAPADSAKIMIDALERKTYRVMVGSDAAFMDKLSRLSPLRAAKTIYTQMKSLLQ